MIVGQQICLGFPVIRKPNASNNRNEPVPILNLDPPRGLLIGGFRFSQRLQSSVACYEETCALIYDQR